MAYGVLHAIYIHYGNEALAPTILQGNCVCQLILLLRVKSSWPIHNAWGPPPSTHKAVLMVCQNTICTSIILNRLIQNVP